MFLSSFVSELKHNPESSINYDDFILNSGVSSSRLQIQQQKRETKRQTDKDKPKKAKKSSKSKKTKSRWKKSTK